MKQITSIIVFISITFLIYGLYNCNCNKNKSYEKFELNSNNPTFLNIINKNMNNIQNISNFNKKLLKNITNSNFDFNLNKNNTENFIDINKITPQDINGLNQIIKNILAGKDKDGNYDINNINIQLNDIKTQLDTFLNQQQTEHQTIINSINSTMTNLRDTSNTLLLQKANISSLKGNQTLFNDIDIITAVPTRLVIPDETSITEAPIKAADTKVDDTKVAVNAAADNKVNIKAADKIAAVVSTADTTTADTKAAVVSTADTTTADKIAADKIAADKIAADKIAADKIAADKIAADLSAAAESVEPDGEGFSNVNQPSPYNNNLILTNFLPLNENKKNIESHKIITRQNKNLFNNLPKSIKMNDFQRCQQDWQLEWAENLRQIRI